MGSPSGPCSTVFRAWANAGKSDIYVAARPVAHSVKLSLHESGRWRMAFTKQFANSGSPVVDPPGDRRANEWTRPAEFEPGWTAAFLVIVPHSQLGPSPAGGIKGDIRWRAAAGRGMETRYWLLLATPVVDPPNEWPGKDSMQTDLVARFQLANGETLWIVCQDVPSPAGNERYYEEIKPVLIARGGIAPEVFQPPGIIRGYLFGTSERELRFYIDLYMPNAA